jgi:SET domain-containing protein
MKVKVAESLIPGAGKGLFAEENIKKGQAIMEVTGPRRLASEIDTHYADNDYLLELNDGTGDCIEVMDGSRYANDAKGFVIIPGLENNAEFCSRDDHSMYLEATRNIKAGEEILVDYGPGYWREFRSQFQPAVQNG